MHLKRDHELTNHCSIKPLTYPDRVTVLHKLSMKPGVDSDIISLDAAIYSEKYQRLAAKCVEEIVVYDYKAAKRTSLRDFMVDDLVKTYDLQQKNQMEMEERVLDMERVLEDFETSERRT